MNELHTPGPLADGLSHPHAVVWEADARTLQFTYVSAGAERLFGYSLAEWLNRPSFWIDFVHPYDRERAYEACRAAVDACEDRELDYRVMRSDGRIAWVRDMLRVVCDGSGGSTALRGVMIDVTDRARRDPSAKQMALVAQFAEATAHDLQNLLTTILGNVDIAISSSMSLGIRQELDQIGQAAESASTLVRQLQAFGQRPIGPLETVDVAAKLAELKGLVGRLAGPQVQLELSVPSASTPVRLGPAMLEQIMLNLAVNARDAMPGGGELRIGLRVVHSPVRDAVAPTHMELEVADTGTGMNRHTRDRIFEPFFTTKEPGRGTGLGLSTVYNIVNQAGGEIDVHSEIGRGTRFTIRLPLAES